MLARFWLKGVWAAQGRLYSTNWKDVIAIALVDTICFEKRKFSSMRLQKGRRTRHTEDDFLRWREHVERKCDFILVALAL